MKLNIKYIAIIGALLFNSAPASAFMGVGDVVTDPGAYTHFIEAAGADAERLKELVEQTKTLSTLRREVAKYQRSLERSYSQYKKRGLDFDAILKDIKDGKRNRSGRERVIIDEINEIDANLDGLIVGKHDAYGWEDGFKTQFDIQELYKKRIRDGRIKAVEVQNQLEDLESLRGDIGRTSNLKESAALRNKLLFQINENTLKMTTLLAVQQEQEALAKYTGYSAKLRAAFAEAAEDRKKSTKKGQRDDSAAGRFERRTGVNWHKLTPQQQGCWMIPFATINDCGS